MGRSFLAPLILILVLCLPSLAAAQGGMNRDLPPPPPDEEQGTPLNATPGATAVLRGLDKVTGRASTFEATVDAEMPFGALLVTVRYCRTRPPEETPESFVFLEIDENQPGEGRVRVFTGWMFASSPALSAMEHPVYDVWLITCKAAAPEDSSGRAKKSP